MSLFSRIFNKSVPLSLNGMTDWHCHILPGVDDGVETMEDSLDILRQYEEIGIKEVWLTPHIMEDVPNTTQALKARFAELKDAYKGSVVLHLAAENMMDNLFKERLDDDNLLTIGDNGKMLLVETSYFSAPINLFKILENIKAKGFYPLLAHPERYSYIDSSSTYKRMKDMGVKFQLNIMSLCGHYGPAAKEKAQRIIKEGWADYFGTDLHRPEHLHILRNLKVEKEIAQIITHNRG